MALLQSGRGGGGGGGGDLSALSQGETPYPFWGSQAEARGLENTPAFGSILMCGQPEGSGGDGAENAASPRPRGRKESRGDRSWATREAPGGAPRDPSGAGPGPHPARRAARGAARAAGASPPEQPRARPRKQGGAAR